MGLTKDWAQKPYSDYEDFPPSLQGIEPRLTVEQANAIARCADEVEGVESPWGVCINSFYESHHVDVDGDRWVKNEEKQGLGGGPLAAGPGGACECPECGYEEVHITGEPCDQRECPECGATMQRREESDMKELSFLELWDAVVMAWQERFEQPAEPTEQASYYDVYPDHIVVGMGEEALSYPYEMTDGGVEFGEPEPVKLEWVPSPASKFLSEALKRQKETDMNDLSYEEIARRVRDAWYNMFQASSMMPKPETTAWPAEVFPEYVIVELAEGYAAYPYEITDEGIEFGEPYPVEDQGWAPTDAAKLLSEALKDREEDREAKERRSERYGIAVLENTSVTMPSEFEGMGATDGDWADPVNYKYIVWYTVATDDLTDEQLGQLRNAPARFAQNKDQYDTKSRGVVADRIERALKKHKIGQYAEEEKGILQVLGDIREKVTALWERASKDAPQRKGAQQLTRFYPSVKAADDGEERWLLVSASAFLDREGEIISRKALDYAIAMAERTGERGPLRLLHLPGADVGDCEFQMRESCFLIEAGTWRETPEARTVKKTVEANPEAWAVSVGFNYDKDYFVDGVYEDVVQIVERSLVKRTKAACPFTTIENTKEVDELSHREDLVAILGGNEEMADELLNKVRQRSAALEPVLNYKDKENERLVGLVETLGESDLKTLADLVGEKLDAIEKDVEFKPTEEAEGLKEENPDLWDAVMGLEQAELEQLKDALDVAEKAAGPATSPAAPIEVELDDEAMKALAEQVSKHLGLGAKAEAQKALDDKLDALEEAIQELSQKLGEGLEEAVVKQMGELPRFRLTGSAYRASQDPDKATDKDTDKDKDKDEFVSPFKERLGTLYEATTSKRS